MPSLPGRSVLAEIVGLHHLVQSAMQTQTLFRVTVWAEEESYGWEGRTCEVGEGICGGSVHNERRKAITPVLHILHLYKHANYPNISASFRKLSKLPPAACCLGL